MVADSPKANDNATATPLGSMGAIMAAEGGPRGGGAGTEPDDAAGRGAPFSLGRVHPKRLLVWALHHSRPRVDIRERPWLWLANRRRIWQVCTDSALIQRYDEEVAILPGPQMESIAA